MKYPNITITLTIIPEESQVKFQATNDGFSADDLIYAFDCIKEKIRTTELIHEDGGEYIEEYFPTIRVEDLRFNQIVYHKDLYWGREPMRIVGIRENEIELEGDYSGGTNNVCQKSWMPIKGILLKQSLNKQAHA